MKHIIRKFALLAITLFVTAVTFAQVTTSSMSGSVKEDNGEKVPGATVIAVHIPSGTQYYTTTDNSGYYRIHNMRIGGPYSISVSFLGYGEVKSQGMYLRLGENFVYDVIMSEEALTLDGAVVSAGIVNPFLNSDKSGTSINVTSREITSLPSINRSIQSFTALTPQSNGFSFAGKDSRLNNFTVDGAGFNNNFGLSGDLPGGGNPISLDAIEEISVNIAPYDVRQSRFTGAAINAVTKSGDNDWYTSVYTYQKFNSFNGTTVAGETVEGADLARQQIYGVSISGPIIKDKLFFFVNAEYDTESEPGVQYTPSTDGIGDGKFISRTSVKDLQRVSDHLKSEYGYDPGKFQDWDPFGTDNYKIMARIDWNIHRDHKFMIRYNEVKGSYMRITNGKSDAPGLWEANSNRMSNQSIAFQNNFYQQNNLVRSVSAELNSTFGSRISNKFLATYTHIRDYRESPSDHMFPHVDIWEGGDASKGGEGGDAYMSFGTELFTYNNETVNNTWSIMDNVTINLNKHTITAGVSFEHMFIKNSYIREGTSYYRYNSVDDFINNATPIAFGLTYGYNGEDAPGQMLTFGNASAYVQDEWQISPNFKLTAGVRFDLPMYFDELQGNNKITEITAALPGGAWDVSSWPNSQVSINPRISFNWDVLGDRSLQIRGGTGLFSGLLPFVWFTNQVGGSGMIQSPEIGWGWSEKDDIYTQNPNLVGLKFNPNHKDLIASDPTSFPTKPNADYLAPYASISVVDKDFKMPQIWRTNIGIDVELPWNMVFTGELLYSRDVNGVVQKNLNESVMTGTLAGPDNRPIMEGPSKIIGDISGATMLTNGDGAYQFQATAQLTKNFSNGLSGMIAYTYSDVKDLSTNPGSSAFSAWVNNSSVNSLNDPGLSHSGFSVPHRVIGNISYRIEYANHLATTVSVVYQGSHTGRLGYIYSGDLNGDGNKYSDIMYVPNDPSEINFVDLKDWKTGEITSAADQSEAFFNYVEGNDYLKSRKGKYAERWGALEKWRNSFDVKILQDIFVNIGAKDRLSLQISLDIVNAGNMLNDNWGTYEYYPMSSYGNMSPLKVASSGSSTKEPTFTLNASSVEHFNSKTTSSPSVGIGSTWGMLLGLRLTF